MSSFEAERQLSPEDIQEIHRIARLPSHQLGEKVARLRCPMGPIPSAFRQAILEQFRRWYREDFSPKHPEAASTAG